MMVSKLIQWPNFFASNQHNQKPEFVTSNTSKSNITHNHTDLENTSLRTANTKANKISKIQVINFFYGTQNTLEHKKDALLKPIIEALLYGESIESVSERLSLSRRDSPNWRELIFKTKLMPSCLKAILARGQKIYSIQPIKNDNTNIGFFPGPGNLTAPPNFFKREINQGNITAVPKPTADILKKHPYNSHAHLGQSIEHDLRYAISLPETRDVACNFFFQNPKVIETLDQVKAKLTAAFILEGNIQNTTINITSQVLQSASIGYSRGGALALLMTVLTTIYENIVVNTLEKALSHPVFLKTHQLEDTPQAQAIRKKAKDLLSSATMTQSTANTFINDIEKLISDFQTIEQFNRSSSNIKKTRKILGPLSQNTENINNLLKKIFKITARKLMDFEKEKLLQQLKELQNSNSISNIALLTALEILPKPKNKDHIKILNDFIVELKANIAKKFFPKLELSIIAFEPVLESKNIPKNSLKIRNWILAPINIDIRVIAADFDRCSVLSLITSDHLLSSEIQKKSEISLSYATLPANHFGISEKNHDPLVKLIPQIASQIALYSLQKRGYDVDPRSLLEKEKLLNTAFEISLKSAELAKKQKQTRCCRDLIPWLILGPLKDRGLTLTKSMEAILNLFYRNSSDNKPLS